MSRHGSRHESRPAPPCEHAERVDGVCTACGHCAHDIVLNGVCYFCGSSDIDAIAMSPKPAEAFVPASQLVRKKPGDRGTDD